MVSRSFPPPYPPTARSTTSTTTSCIWTSGEPIKRPHANDVATAHVGVDSVLLLRDHDDDVSVAEACKKLNEVSGLRGMGR